MSTYVSHLSGAAVDIVQLLVGTGVASALAILSLLTRALSLSGAAAMAVVGAVVFGLGGPAFDVPIIFFFVTSSLASKVVSPSKIKSMKAFDKTGPRDGKQVLANGGAAAVSVILYTTTGWIGWYVVYLAAICEACADTWATEMGTLSKKEPVSIVGFRRVAAGRSGGVTLLGTVAAFGGSATTALSGFILLYALNVAEASVSLILIVPTCCGFTGALADSAMGATIQAQYLNSEGSITERPRQDSRTNKQIKGLKWVTNDIVNLASTSVAAVGALLAALAFKL